MPNQVKGTYTLRLVVDLQVPDHMGTADGAEAARKMTEMALRQCFWFDIEGITGAEVTFHPVQPLPF